MNFQSAKTVVAVFFFSFSPSLQILRWDILSFSNYPHWALYMQCQTSHGNCGKMFRVAAAVEFECFLLSVFRTLTMKGGVHHLNSHLALLFLCLIRMCLCLQHTCWNVMNWVMGLFCFLLFFSLVCHSALHSGAHARNWWQFFHTGRLGLGSVAAHQCLPEEVIDVTSARFVLHKGCACFVCSLHQLISNRYRIYQTDGNHDIYIHTCMSIMF